MQVLLLLIACLFLLTGVACLHLQTVFDPALFQSGFTPISLALVLLTLSYSVACLRKRSKA